MNSQREAPLFRGRIGNLVTLGLNIGLGMSLFAGAGYYVDLRMGTLPRFSLIGAGIGFVYVAWEIFKVVRHLDAYNRSPDDPPPPVADHRKP